MSNWYKPKYKVCYRLRNKIWINKNFKLRKLVDKRGKVLIRRGWLHRRGRPLKSLKWNLIRRQFGISFYHFSFRKLRRFRRLHPRGKYIQDLLRFKGFRFFYGKLNTTFLINLYKNIYKKKRTFKLLNLLKHLELRLDMVVYRLRWVPTIYMANQLISHHGISVNQIQLNKPSTILKIGDVIYLSKGFWDIMEALFLYKFNNYTHRKYILNKKRFIFKYKFYKKIRKLKLYNGRKWRMGSKYNARRNPWFKTCQYRYIKSKNFFNKKKYSKLYSLLKVSRERWYRHNLFFDSFNQQFLFANNLFKEPLIKHILLKKIFVIVRILKYYKKLFNFYKRLFMINKDISWNLILYKLKLFTFSVLRPIIPIYHLLYSYINNLKTFSWYFKLYNYFKIYFLTKIKKNKKKQQEFQQKYLTFIKIFFQEFSVKFLFLRQLKLKLWVMIFNLNINQDLLKNLTNILIDLLKIPNFIQSCKVESLFLLKQFNKKLSLKKIILQNNLLKSYLQINEEEDSILEQNKKIEKFLKSLPTTLIHRQEYFEYFLNILLIILKKYYLIDLFMFTSKNNIMNKQFSKYYLFALRLFINNNLIKFKENVFLENNIMFFGKKFFNKKDDLSNILLKNFWSTHPLVNIRQYTTNIPLNYFNWKRYFVECRVKPIEKRKWKVESKIPGTFLYSYRFLNKVLQNNDKRDFRKFFFKNNLQLKRLLKHQEHWKNLKEKTSNKKIKYIINKDTNTVRLKFLTLNNSIKYSKWTRLGKYNPKSYWRFLLKVRRIDALKQKRFFGLTKKIQKQRLPHLEVDWITLRAIIIDQPYLEYLLYSYGSSLYINNFIMYLKRKGL